MKRARQYLLRCVLAIVVAVCGLAASTPPASSDVRLRVKVFDCETKEPIVGALVAVPTSRAADKSDETNAKGIADIYPVRPGGVTHRVEISARGYLPYQNSVYLKANSTQYFEICLRRSASLTYTPTRIATSTPTFTSTSTPTLTPSPTLVTETPTVTPVPEVVVATAIAPTPEATATLTTLDACQCSLYLWGRLKDLMTAEDLGSLASWLSGGTNCLSECTASDQKFGAALECYTTCGESAGFSQLAQAVAKKAHLGGTSPGQVTAALADVLGHPGVEVCGRVNFFTRELVKALGVYGVSIDYVGLHSPATALVTDRQGRRAGFLKDSGMVVEIPDAKVMELGGSKYILFPSQGEVSVTIQGTGDGLVDFELLHTGEETVRDLAFYDVPVTANTAGGIEPSAPEPVLVVDTQGNGNQSRLSPSRMADTPTTRLSFETPTSTPTVVPSRTPAPVSAAPVNWLGEGEMLYVGLGVGCISSLLLVSVLGMLWSLISRSKRRPKRSRAAVPGQRVPQCPGCGQALHPAHRFCPACGRKL